MESDQNVFEKIYQIIDYKEWDHTIYQSAEDFKTHFEKYPNILLGNSATLEAFDLFMSKKLLEEGKIVDTTSMGQFACSKFILEICLDEDLEDHTFKLVRDDEAEFLEQEPDPKSLPIEV